MPMPSNFSVQIEKYAEGHFIKSFEKKYKGHWSVTLSAIIAQLERIDNLIKAKRVDTIISKDGVVIIKMDFAVAGTQISPRGSGNRCILALYEKEKIVKILLVYSKTDLSGHNETAEWQGIIKENYLEYRNIIK